MPPIKANRVTLEYDERGPTNGTPILMIMGFGAQMTWWPEEFLYCLADAGLRVFRYDNRDVWLSEKWDCIIPDIAAARAQARRNEKPDIPYSLLDMAADAVGVLDALGIETAHILGGSMGGMIAQLVAIEHRARARSLISMFSTTGDRSLPRAAPDATAALTSRPTSTERDAVIAHALNNRKAYASTAFPFDAARAAAATGASFDRSYYPQGALRHWAAFITAPPRTEALKKLHIPALVIHGSADRLIPCEAGRHTAACIDGADYFEIEGWGHEMPIEVIPMLVDAIVPFVARVEAMRRG